ncbi:MAG TPA: CoA transferase [Candidatus Nitrosotalea sp.]|nr:CoA transferase [Candidatus Nitrosotalea sp.]
MSWPNRRQPDVQGALAGIKVLDLSAFAVGPWSAGLLATLGADVIKVDPPYGDPIRRVRPQRAGEPTTYSVCNLGKRAITLDFKDPAAHRLVMEMAASADVIIENHRAGAMERVGVGYEQVSAVNPGIIYCSSGSFGDRGPMAGVGSTDPHGQAFSGFVALNGVDADHPEFLRYSALIDLFTSMYLAGAALVGLELRAHSGRGCHLVTSQMESAISLQMTRLSEYLATGIRFQPAGSASSAIAPSQAFRCRDGRYLNVSAPGAGQWQALCQVLSLAELIDDPRFLRNRDRLHNRAELTPILAGAMAKADLAWWRMRLAEAGVPAAEAHVLDDAVANPEEHPLGRFMQRVPHPVRGRMVVPRPPWDFSRSPAVARAPSLPGAHDAEIRAGLESAPGSAPAPEPAPPSGTPGSRTSLKGLKVVEAAGGVAGPYCGWLLAGLGAEVVRVETQDGDPLREHGPEARDGLGAAYLALNGGKVSFVVDPTLESDAARLHALLAAADVVIADHRSMAREGALLLGGDEVEGNPRAVVCSLSAAGEEGPLAERPLDELEIQGLSGLLRYLGEPGSAPVRMGADVAAIGAGVTAFVGVMAALHERRRSGLGQKVAVSELGALVSAGAVMIAALGHPDAWEGFHCLAAGTPPIYGVSSRGGLVSFTAPRQDADWEEFCRTIGAEPLLQDPLYATDEQRTFRRPELLRELVPYFAPHERDFLIDLTNRLGGIAVPILTYEDLVQHPQVRAVEIIVDGPEGPALALPWRIDGWRPPPPGASVALP